MSELSLKVAACPVSWDGVADSVWLCGSGLYYQISQSIVDVVQRVDPATNCPSQFCAHLLYDFCHFYSSLLLEGDLNYPLSMHHPFQFFGIRSLILDGSRALGAFVAMCCIAVSMLCERERELKSGVHCAKPLTLLLLC